MNGKEIKSKLISNLEFMLKNLGDVKDWRDCSNPKKEEFNNAVDSLHDINFLITNDNNENLMHELFTECYESSDYSSVNYMTFFCCVEDFSTLPYYGGGFRPSNQRATLDDYTIVRTRINNFLRLLNGLIYSNNNYIIYSGFVENKKSNEIKKALNKLDDNSNNNYLNS